MMWALVPMKSFRAAKTRLDPLVSPANRQALARAMAADVLDVLLRCPDLDGVAICSPDPEVLAFARARGCTVIPETFGTGGLNEAVAMSAAQLRETGTGHIMVVHGDLPMVSGDEITALLIAYRKAQDPAIAVTPDRRGDGSNLLIWPLNSGFVSSYGPDSFSRHLQQAHRLGLHPLVQDLAGAAWDVDRMEDLVPLMTSRWHRCGPATRSILQTIRHQTLQQTQQFTGVSA